MRNLILLLVLLQLVSCKKDKVGFILEKSFGAGSAYDTEIASDTTFLIAGESKQKPLFIKTGSGSAIDINYSPDYPGRYTEVIEVMAGYLVPNAYLLAGCSEGDILLALIDGEGGELWDTIIAVGPNISTSQICQYNEDTYMLVGSDNPDSLNSSSYVAALFDINAEIFCRSTKLPRVLMHLLPTLRFCLPMIFMFLLPKIWLIITARLLLPG